MCTSFANQAGGGESASWSLRGMGMDPLSFSTIVQSNSTTTFPFPNSCWTSIEQIRIKHVAVYVDVTHDINSLINERSNRK